MKNYPTLTEAEDLEVRYRLLHELCACGHLRLTHAGKVSHGFCCNTYCDCIKFTWTKNLVDEGEIK